MTDALEESLLPSGTQLFYSSLPLLPRGGERSTTPRPASRVVGNKQSILPERMERITQVSDFSELLLSMGRALKPLQREWVRTLPRPRTKVPEEKGGPGPRSEEHTS